MNARRKAAIRTVGQATAPGRSSLHPDGLVCGWAMEGGDYPGVDLTTSKMGGWTTEELALIAEVGRAHGHQAAVDLAERCR